MLLKKKDYSHTLIFLPDVQERHIRYTKAADITIYAVTERHGLPTRISDIRECNNCGPIIIHDIDKYLSESILAI